MSAPLLPFLYRTRTLQRAIGRQNVASIVRFVHGGRPGRPRRQDNSIPFEWDDDAPYDESTTGRPDQPSTITPSEAQVFEGIFDDIAQGRMPSAKKRQSASVSGTNYREPDMARSIVEQARVMDFREKILRRYPPSLRDAAQIALGLYELEPNGQAESKMMELDEGNQTNWKERATYEQERTRERQRVDQMMNECQTDADLWRVMEEQVFSLPVKLGIAQQKTHKSKGKAGKTRAAAAAASQRQTADNRRRIMDVHGPLFPHFINSGLALFETGFARPSEHAFQILPRIKELGLPAYVLGVSTPFYARLAQMHWTRFGDAASALDVLREMNSAGLYADEQVHQLLVTMRNHLHACTWGAQGPFVMGMMDAPPYDAALTQRIEEMEKFAKASMNERAAEMEAA